MYLIQGVSVVDNKKEWQMRCRQKKKKKRSGKMFAFYLMLVIL